MPLVDDNETMILRKATIVEDKNTYKIRTTSSGTFTPSGLRTAGLVTEITLSSSAWTKLERSGTTTPTGSGNLTATNAIKIVNTSAIDIKINFQEAIDDVLGYIGDPIPAGGIDYWDVDLSAVSVYARSQTGTPSITLVEIS